MGTCGEGPDTAAAGIRQRNLCVAQAAGQLPATPEALRAKGPCRHVPPRVATARRARLLRAEAWARPCGAGAWLHGGR